MRSRTSAEMTILVSILNTRWKRYFHAFEDGFQCLEWRTSFTAKRRPGFGLNPVSLIDVGGKYLQMRGVPTGVDHS